MGRLSNPELPMLADQGHADLAHAKEDPQMTEPVWRRIQHRLDTLEIDKLVADYQAGRSLADLASEFDIHRRTVAMHLERRGVARRATLRKMSHTDIEEATRRYRAAIPSPPSGALSMSMLRPCDESCSERE